MFTSERNKVANKVMSLFFTSLINFYNVTDVVF